MLKGIGGMSESLWKSSGHSNNLMDSTRVSTSRPIGPHVART